MNAMALTYPLLDFRRMIRNPARLLFSVVMPAGFYVMFGAIQNYSNITLTHGNMSATVMVSMALYGTSNVASSLGAQAALEQDRGWGRQLALTPMTSGRYLAAKGLSVQLVALAPVAIVFILGAVTGARIDGIGWAWAFLACWLCCVPLTLFGLGMAQLLRSDTAIQIASFAIVGFSFLGDMFFPLSGFMLKLSRFTPLYGVNQIVRYPVMGGWALTGEAPARMSMWPAIANLAAWTVVFAALALVASRRGQER